MNLSFAYLCLKYLQTLSGKSGKNQWALIDDFTLGHMGFEYGEYDRTTPYIKGEKA